MIKLKTIFEVIDEYEIEDLNGKDAILQYLTSHGATPEVIVLGKDEYIIWDDKIVDPEFPYPKEKEKWLYDTDAMRLVNTLTDMVEEQFNNRFWMYPELLYHGTPKENVPLIKLEGLKMRHLSRGLSNRHISAAVFTAQSPEFCMQSYGPEVFEINTIQMKADGFMPFVTKEPNHTEADVINFIAKKIKAWDDEKDLANSYSEGTTDDTVIIYSNIPPKYLTLL
jgi:hypothetical protein